MILKPHTPLLKARSRGKGISRRFEWENRRRVKDNPAAVSDAARSPPRRFQRIVTIPTLHARVASWTNGLRVVELFAGVTAELYLPLPSTRYVIRKTT